LEYGEIPDKVYLRVCEHLKKAHDALVSKRHQPRQQTGATDRRCWRCFDFYPDMRRELLRRAAGTSDEDAATLTMKRMRIMTGISVPVPYTEMHRHMVLRNHKIQRERMEARLRRCACRCVLSKVGCIFETKGRYFIFGSDELEFPTLESFIYTQPQRSASAPINKRNSQRPASAPSNRQNIPVTERTVGGMEGAYKLKQVGKIQTAWT
jgi:hypothetical protein